MTDNESILSGGEYTFCVYDEPSTDLCLHRDLYLANVHQRAVKRDGVRSIRIEQELACSIIATSQVQICACTGLCIWRMYISELSSEMMLRLTKYEK